MKWDKIFKVLGKTFAKPIIKGFAYMTKNPQGYSRYIFVKGGQNVYYYQTKISRNFAGISTDEEPKLLKEDQAIAFFSEFLIEVVIIYGFIGGYAIMEVFEKQKKEDKEDEVADKYMQTVKLNHQKINEIYDKVNKINQDTNYNSVILEQINQSKLHTQKLQKILEDLEQEQNQNQN